MLKIPPILITGSHRSGTTWVGNILCQAKHVFYIHEPFDPNGITRKQGLFNIWFKYIPPSSKNHLIYYQIESLLKCQYSLLNALHLRNTIPEYDFRNPKGTHSGKFNYKNIGWRLKQFKNSLHYRRKISKSPDFHYRGLIKDPIAIFSAEWLNKNFNTKNLILIRHPAAFVSSLKRLNWHFNFKNFLQQPDLMTDHLYPYEEKLKDVSGNIIEEASLLWLCIHHVIKYYQKIHPEWLYKRHEDISYNPLTEFEDIFRYMNLEFSDETKESIEDSTSSSNPAEVTKEGKIHQLNRDSRTNIYNWKKRLTAQEIEIVRSITKNVSDFFYSDDEW